MAVMISLELMIYCLLAAGAYLLIISLLLDFVERRLKLTATLPDKLVESTGLSFTLANFILELLFYVAIPTIVYTFFYYLLPFYGVRAGMATGLFAFVLGSVPALMGLAVRIKLPMPYVLYVLLAILLKLIGCLGIIGYLYTL
jgi:hypothetical protein